ncbi:MAG TPA: alpha/beta hydrolase [Pyrinomonadaceae bacterium]|jgi:acetyl esterase/lipase|nr:alpha/beta hydrolase [Pyrinomonadaceae bacterium]
MNDNFGTQTARTLQPENDPRLSPGTKEFLKALNSPAPPELEKLTPVEARKVLFDAQMSVEFDYSDIDEAEKTISADGFEIKLNLVRPAGVTEKLPVFLFIHGGGWVLGDYPTHRRMVRDLVVESGAAAVFVNYTPTPDAVYPQQINEIYAALKWVEENGDEINVDGKDLAVVGNSVGGNMTAVMTLMAKEKGGPEIKFQIMMWPIVDADFETKSYRQFGEKRFLSASLMKWMYDMYIPSVEKRREIYASPLRASVEQLKGLPPALVITAESDILRDEGEAYGRKLDAAGVPVLATRYDGMIHDFGLLNGLAHLPQVGGLFVHAGAVLRKHLKKNS